MNARFSIKTWFQRRVCWMMMLLWGHYGRGERWVCLMNWIITSKVCVFINSGFRCTKSNACIGTQITFCFSNSIKHCLYLSDRKMLVALFRCFRDNLSKCISSYNCSESESVIQFQAHQNRTSSWARLNWKTEKSGAVVSYELYPK